jgi:hypothetical protein
MVAKAVATAEVLSYRLCVSATTRSGRAPIRLLRQLQDLPVVKRAKRSGPPETARIPETRPVSPLERHSGEGSASALETLQKLEKRRTAAKPSDPA